jgi:hypothetical protein
MLYSLYQVKMPQLPNWLQLYRLTFISFRQLHHLHVDWVGPLNFWMPTLFLNLLSDDNDGSRMSITSEKSGHKLLINDSDGHRKISGAAYVGFVVDANVTSYLMMGSLSPG